MNFKTQIGTTREQSERLIALGVLPETADMCYNTYFDTPNHEVEIDMNHGGSEVYENKMYIPAWSLSRLIEMLPNEVQDPKPGFSSHHPELIKHDSGYNLSIRRYAADCLVGTHIEDNPIDCCVSMIEWLIKNDHFNKEYLKGGKP